MSDLIQPTLLLEGPFCNKIPDPKYWLAIRAAKKAIGNIAKDKKLPKEAGKKASEAKKMTDEVRAKAADVIRP